METHLLTLDAGGGTVDITIHEIDSKRGNLVEKTIRGGGFLGSTVLDKRFLDLCNKQFGASIMEKFKLEHLQEYNELVNEWERNKVKIETYKEKKFVNVPVVLVDLIKGDKNSAQDVTFFDKNKKSNKISLTGTHLRAIFEQPIQEICNLLQEQLNQLSSKVDYIFLVGGFCQNGILRAEINRKFAGSVTKQIVHEKFCGDAVHVGAALTGRDPSIIRCRKSKYRYGISISKEEDEEEAYGKQNKVRFSVLDSGRFGFKEFFKVFVERGQEVGAEDEVEQEFLLPKNQSQVIVPIYNTPVKDVCFTNESKISKIGEIGITVTAEPKDRIIKVIFNFHGVLLKVSVILESGEKGEADLKFFSGQ